jgi:hypothetical protein
MLIVLFNDHQETFKIILHVFFSFVHIQKMICVEVVAVMVAVLLVVIVVVVLVLVVDVVVLVVIVL